MRSTSLPQLVTAYRKAKVDLFYSSDPRRRDLVEYEELLDARLERLRQRIAGRDDSWVEDPEFLGGFTFVPKQLLRMPKDEVRTLWSDPGVAWIHKARAAKEAREPIVADFRLMSECSIDFHVFSTLWMLEVGTKLDGRLRESARGSRLRKAPDGGPNVLGLGSFQHYPSAYRRWRDEGLLAMTEALDEQRSVIALTADVTSFYHRLDPSFLLRRGFVTKVLGTSLTLEQRRLTKLFVKALLGWARNVGEEMRRVDPECDWPQSGLPVGLPASAVVANLALAELDAFIEGLEPEFYGRYVDDITLVVEDHGDLIDQRSVWEWLAGKSDGLLTVGTDRQPDDSSEEALILSSSYLNDSTIAFANSKNKTFHLAGPSGRAVIDSIRTTIQERNSEWRSLANVPGAIEEIEPALAAARRIDGDGAATLRDADDLSARKAAFAVRLRDFEAYERALRPAEWRSHREEFVRVACEQVLSLPAFVELGKYLPRLVALAAACQDGKSVRRLFMSVARLPGLIRTNCDVSVAALLPPLRGRAARQVLERWEARLLEQSVEALAAGWSDQPTHESLQRMFAPLRRLESNITRKLPSARQFDGWHRRLASRDLAHDPYRWTVLHPHLSDATRPALLPPLPLPPALAFAANALVDALTKHQPVKEDRSSAGSLDAGLVFATRPPSMMEISRALPGGRERYGIASPELVTTILHGLRGFFGSPPIEFEDSEDGFPCAIRISARRDAGPLRLALAMLDTDVLDAVAAADGRPNTSAERYEHLKKLIKAVGDHPDRVDYLLLPELSMPADWFDEFARGLRRSGISLIAGIEHQPYAKGKAANQVWAALAADGWGHNYFLYQQDKQRPALPERKQVLEPVGRKLDPLIPWPHRVPPVLAHGDFRFALLICSEFTNIEYRSRLRGAVDAILVPEWNQDLHTFEALVESAALDVHAYIAQANTRGLGDTRLRAPMKQDWARDVVRLKGGLSDYFVIGEVDVDALRRAHWGRPAMPTRPGGHTPAEFKPTPDGFEPDPRRKVLRPQN